MFAAPRYGTGSLADLFPSLLAGFGVPGERDRLGLDIAADRVCVLLIDGLGAAALAANPGVAPFLSGLPSVALTTGFPSTTATSLSSLGVGVPPGEHGIVGYLMRVPEQDRLVNSLRWRLHGEGARVDLLSELVPEAFQPTTTVFERAAAQGIVVTQVAPNYQNGSGLTRAVLRGCAFRPAFSVGDLVDGVGIGLRAGDRTLVYAYYGDLDTTGHVRGPSSDAWLLELAHVDRIAADIAERLPQDAALCVTADHGMVELGERIDFDEHAGLRAGVRHSGSAHLGGDRSDRNGGRIDLRRGVGGADPGSQHDAVHDNPLHPRPP
ncbi:alkaline phosphatase family protein, partial [Nocardia brasiliensis]|uniref:alkaline phosphatase family protein n=1 Tax=Nocardia brasiliensis TaxID=37326 RepID=UPI0024578741